MSILTCPQAIVGMTLDHLKAAGQKNDECIVLWLGRRIPGYIEILEAYRPEQTARHDQFRILPDAMASLRTHLRGHRLMIAAQVHSHPAKAFHSVADDVGAIIRHVGALSFVVPWFAEYTTVESFTKDVALFELQSDDLWLHIPSNLINTKCQVTL